MSSTIDKVIEENRIKELAARLHEKIYLKRHLRMPPTKKQIIQQNEKLEKMFKHPKMTKEILGLYMKAIERSPIKNIPNPIEIFNDTTKHHKLYLQYVISLIQKMKDENLERNQLEVLLDNPYARYISRALMIPLNPLTRKTNNVDNTVPELVAT